MAFTLSYKLFITKFIKADFTDYSDFKSSSKMIWEQAAAAASQVKREKKKSLCEILP